VEIAFLAQGRVFGVGADGRPQELESPFVRAVRERALRQERAQGWKNERQGGLLSGAALWGGGAGLDDATRVVARGLCAGARPGELLYALDTGRVAGAFRLAIETGEELRLFHANQLRVRDLAAEPEGARIACSLLNRDGSADLAIVGEAGPMPRAVTSGDSVDAAPCWIPKRHALVFQSAGIGRDSAGSAVELGPATLEELELESGELATRASDPRFDFLAPRFGPDGLLHALRRPYRPRSGGSAWRRLADLSLVPLRLVQAVYGWLDFFSMRYGGRRLSTTGGAAARGEADLRQLVIHGNTIDAERAARRGRLRGEDAPALVPRSWELVRWEDAEGEPRVLARHALAFDVARDGSLLVSNGSAIDRLGPDGRSERVCRAPGIEQVAALR